MLIATPQLTPAGARQEPAGVAAQPPLIHPGHETYDAARAAWNLAVDQRPACICVATEVAHVQAAMAYARAHGLTVAAQTTGHLSQTLPSLHRTLLLSLNPPMWWVGSVRS